MAFKDFLRDLLTLNFSDAEKRIHDFENTLPTPVHKAVDEVLTPEGQILQGMINNAVPTLIKDGGADGLTTKAIVDTAKDLFAQLAAQNIAKYNLPFVFGLLNLTISETVPSPAAVEAPSGSTTQG